MLFSLHIDTAVSWRGGQSQVLHTVMGLRARGHRAALVAHPNGELARRAQEGHDLIRLAPLHEVDFAAALKLSRVLRELNPDVVHAHDPHAVAMTAMALSMLGRDRRPAFVVARRVDFHLKQNSFSRWKYKLAECVVCSSNAIRAMVIEDGIPDDRAITVYEGVDVDRIADIPAADVHTELWLPPHAPVVGNVAALVAHKGQRYLIEAVPVIVHRLPDVQVLLFGEGELRSQLQRQIKALGLDHHVRLVGFQPNVLALIKSLDVFVMSSITEGLGTSILDAMASSKPVVATDAGGIPEVVEHGVTGLLVPAQKPAAMAEAILRLLNDAPLRTQMGNAGLERVRARFSVDRMVDQTLAVYERVAGRRHAAGNGSPPPAG
jgi:glycosyltransferase involved in cell wall biosynthesis